MALYSAPTRIVPIFNANDYPDTQLLTNEDDLTTIQGEIDALQIAVDALSTNITRQGTLFTTNYTEIATPYGVDTPVLLGSVMPSSLTENWIITVNVDITAIGGSDANIGNLYIWWNNSATTYNQAWNNLSVCAYRDTIATSYNFMFFKTNTTSSNSVPCYIWYAFFDVGGGVIPVIGEFTTAYYPIGQTQYTNQTLIGFPDYTLV